LRRLSLGPDATLYFESYDTMWFQIHEMLYIEKGGEEQIADELTAYNPLIPNGSELVATMMFEIDDEVRRARVLYGLTDVELKTYVDVGGEKIFAVPEQDVERTSPDGKTSSVHFLHFPLSASQKESFKVAGTDVIIGCEHSNYPHMVRLSEESRAELAKDLD
ncbi:MAG: DUF3501 family protein, partial [Alphaproteobacteria bacterium]